MLRQLLALLALLTGLAAIGAPVQAAVNSAVGVGVGVEQPSDSRDTETRDAQNVCADKQRKQKLRGEKVTPCKKQEPVTVYIPSVMFGADRAYE